MNAGDPNRLIQASSAWGRTNPRAPPNRRNISYWQELRFCSKCDLWLSCGSTDVSHTRVAAGQNTTFFLAKPSDKLSDLPRHPLDMEAPELCVVCKQDTGDDDSLLECEKASIAGVGVPTAMLISVAVRQPVPPAVP